MNPLANDSPAEMKRIHAQDFRVQSPGMAVARVGSVAFARWVTRLLGGRSVWLILCFGSGCRIANAIAPPYVPDTELVKRPLIVVAHWDKARIVSNIEYRDQAPVGRTVTGLEVHTNLVVDRVIQGDVQPGVYKLQFGFGVTWQADGKFLSTGTSTEIPGDVSDVTTPNIWFLSRSRARDSADQATYLVLDTYRGVQPLALEPYFHVLMAPGAEHKVVALLDSGDKQIVHRVLYYLHGFRTPWPLEDFMEVYIHQPHDDELKRPQHAHAVANYLRGISSPDRPFAAAVYSSLAGAGSRRFVQTLMDDKDADVRTIAAAWLSRWRDSDSVPAFRHAVVGCSDPAVTCRLIEEMANWGSARLVPTLITFLEMSTNGGYIGNDYFTPALKARQALLSITGYRFPFRVRSSLAAWDAVKRTGSKHAWRKGLVHALGGDRIQLRARLLRSHGLWAEITNVSPKPVLLASKPQAIEIEGRLSSLLDSSDVDAKYTQLAPRTKLRIALTDSADLAAIPLSEIKVTLRYPTFRLATGCDSWAGTLQVESGKRIRSTGPGDGKSQYR